MVSIYHKDSVLRVLPRIVPEPQHELFVTAKAAESSPDDALLRNLVAASDLSAIELFEEVEPLRFSVEEPLVELLDDRLLTYDARSDVDTSQQNGGDRTQAASP